MLAGGTGCDGCSLQAQFVSGQKKTKYTCYICDTQNRKKNNDELCRKCGPRLRIRPVPDGTVGESYANSVSEYNNNYSTEGLELDDNSCCGCRWLA